MAPVTGRTTGSAGEVQAGDAVQSDARVSQAVNAESAKSGSGTETHCRVALIGEVYKRWKIRPATLDSFVNKNGYDYYIYESWHGTAQTTHGIREGDRMYVYKDGAGQVFLEHSGRRHTEELSVKAGPLILEKNLWAKGEAYSASGDHIGTFYLYRRMDKLEGRHPNSLRTPCRSAHFEYFDAGVARDRPVLASSCDQAGATVFPIDCDACNGAEQTDDGDGDEGLR